jgi:hypothetical protein
LIEKTVATNAEEFRKGIRD